MNINFLLNISKGEKIPVIGIESINIFQSSSMNNDLEKLYLKLKDKLLYLDKKLRNNFILLVFFISKNSLIIINSNKNDIKI